MSPTAFSRIVGLATLLSALVSLAAAQGTTSSTSPTSSVGPTPTPPPAPTPPPPAQATYPATPLASKGPFAYPSGIPYKVDTDTHLIRGPQHGFNICNSTTENQNSLCQTMFVNSLDDFCLWGPPEMGREVGDIEGIMVAYCTKPGHGTRLIPAGALTGVQFMETPDYIQVVGFIDQTKINILEGDWGGEMDPHGADLRGNPMGGIGFSDHFTGSPIQVMEWHNFIGGNRFCMKFCDPRGRDDAHFCEHIFDRIGVDYNCPNAAQDGVFESCKGENQDFPGTYTTNGVVMTYTQPPGPIVTIPYVARVPASSDCQKFSSSAVFTGLPSTSGGSTSGTRTGTSSSRSTGTGSSSSGTSTATNGANNNQTGAATSLGLQFSAVFTFIGFVASVALLS